MGFSPATELGEKRDLNGPSQSKEWVFYEFTAYIITLHWHLPYHLDRLK